MNLRISALGMAAALASLLSVSCATTRNSANKPGLVCPQCRVVVTYVESDELPFEGLESLVVDGADSVALGDPGPVEQLRHECPGCEGHLRSLFKRGKFEHRCSVCEKTPYTCKIAHPEIRPQGRQLVLP